MFELKKVSDFFKICFPTQEFVNYFHIQSVLNKRKLQCNTKCMNIVNIF